MAINNFDDAKYENWLKESLSLHYMKKGLEIFAETQSKALHRTLLASLKPNCTDCSTSMIHKLRQNQGWSIKCDANICNKWLDNIVKYHLCCPCPDITWENTDIQQWTTEHWEIAKIFQPYGCQEHRSARDTDSAGILTLIQNCQFFHTFVTDIGLLKQIKEVRNRIMHSNSILVEDKDMNNDVDRIVQLLDNIRHLTNISELEKDSADAAVRKIQELRSKPLDLCLNRQLEQIALSERLKAMEDKLSEYIRQYEIIIQDNQRIKSDVDKFKLSADDFEKTKEDVRKSKTVLTELLTRTESLEEKIKDSAYLNPSTKVSKHICDVSSRFESEETRINSLKDIEIRLKRCEMQLQRHDQEEDDNSQTQTNLRKRKLETSKRPSKKIRVTEEERNEKIEAEVKETQSHVLQLYQTHYRKIPIFPLRPKIKIPVGELYVKPIMKIIDPHGKHPAEEQCSRGNDVYSYRDIFYKDGRPCKNIYIKGEAGVGKSTFCEWMVHQWCQAHSDGRSDTLTEDEEVLLEFPLLFYVSLRESAATRSQIDHDKIDEMIKTQLSLKKFDIAEIFVRQKCLVILDGLDEWTPHEGRISTRLESKDLPQRELFRELTVLTTSRPWKLDMLRYELEDKTDNLISITGLGKTSTERLAHNVIKILNKEYSRGKDIEDFLQDIQKNCVQHFMKTPVLLMQLVCLWHDGIPFGNSECDIYSNMVDRQLQLAEIEKNLPKASEFSSSMINLPGCLQKKPHIKKYAALLISLSKLAFNTLFNKNKEKSLVFNDEETQICGMTSSELETCFKVGLLSQTTLQEKITKETRSINFIHKTYQEFFASVHLSTQTQPDMFEMVSKSITSLEQALEFQKVLTFVCGMNPVVAYELSGYIMHQVCNDDRVHEYRLSCVGKWWYIPFLSLVKGIQTMVLDGLEEAKQNGFTDVHLQLEDLIVHGTDWDMPFDYVTVSRVIKHIGALKMDCVKSVLIVTPRSISSKDQKREWETMIGWVRQIKFKKIVIFDRCCYIRSEKIFNMVCHSKSCLTSLVLSKVVLSEQSPSLFEILSELNLESLGLEKMKLTHEQLNTFTRFLQDTNKLKQLNFQSIGCTTHDVSENGAAMSAVCEYSIDLSSHHQLQELYLVNIDVVHVQVNSHNLTKCELQGLSQPGAMTDVLRALPKATNLQDIQIGCKYCENTKVFAEILSQLSTVHNVEVKDTDFGESSLVLSPDVKNLTVLTLKDVIVTNVALLNLVDSLPTHRVEVYLLDIEITAQSKFGMPNVLGYIRQSQKFTVTQEDKDDWFSESPKSTMIFHVVKKS